MIQMDNQLLIIGIIFLVPVSFSKQSVVVSSWMVQNDVDMVIIIEGRSRTKKTLEDKIYSIYTKLTYECAFGDNSICYHM